MYTYIYGEIGFLGRFSFTQNRTPEERVRNTEKEKHTTEESINVNVNVSVNVTINLNVNVKVNVKV